MHFYKYSCIAFWPLKRVTVKRQIMLQVNLLSINMYPLSNLIFGFAQYASVAGKLVHIITPSCKSKSHNTILYDNTFPGEIVVRSASENSQ